jgi:glucuronate isomerase
MADSMLDPERFFSAEPAARRLARTLYEPVASLPIVSPHGHVDPRLFSDPQATFGTPADLFVLPDHYVKRMLVSQGIPLASLILSAGRGESADFREQEHRRVWRLFCANFHLFRGTPSGIWLRQTFSDLFGINEKPGAANADSLYDLIACKLATPEYTPRLLFERFKIEVLCTTDAATDSLEHHRAIQASGWKGCIRPTFRPDTVLCIDSPAWNASLELLRAASGVDIVDYASFIRALEQRREFFKQMGATATDHAALTPATGELDWLEAQAIFQRALKGQASAGDAALFSAHMLMQMARMSIEDGLVMQLHTGSLRNHHAGLFQQYGPDLGADIPVQTEFTRNLRPLLNKYGTDPRLTLILFTLDESTYARELAPLAGFYPAIRIGPPWWFHDSLNGIKRYFGQVMETAGLYNTAGFNDDTRAFCSIPARHDVWRRLSANWVAGLVVRHVVDMEDARDMLQELAIGLAKRAYRLP